MSIVDSAPSPFTSFPRVAVLGGAGKMGSGISLLLLQELAICRLLQAAELLETKGERFCLILIDTSREGLVGVRKYLQAQLLRWAEKNIVFLRQKVANLPLLISNKEIIDFFVAGAMEIVHFASALEEAKDAQLIFEAIVEDVNSKVDVLKRVNQLSTEKPYFFSNTSAIPLSILNAEADLDGRIIGFHFYNPPAVQKLIEIIPLAGGDEPLKALAIAIAQKFNKRIVFSKDVAGFIGNGYFLREIMHACAMVKQLRLQQGILHSIYLVNRVTQEFLLRPMGIFQLIDYVGLDVIDKVGKVMNRYLPAPVYESELFEPLLRAGKSGGQFSNGSQKDGFFHYVNNRISGIYAVNEQRYCPLEGAEWKSVCDAWLGDPPGGVSWKALSKASNSQEQIQDYFRQLQAEKTPGAQMAMDFLVHLQQVTCQLVEGGVALNLEEVGTVLKNGFYHLYDVHAIKK